MFNNEEILTAREVADLLKVTTTWVYHKKSEGKLPAHKIGGTIRFLKSEVLEWAKNQ